MKKKEFIIIGILIVLLAFMDISGLPCSLFINIEVLDITPFYFTLMFNFVIIGIIAFLTLKYLCPNWKLGLNKTELITGLKKYGIAGIVVGIISAIAFYIGLKPFNYSPTIWKVLIEGIIYYIGVAIVEELYVRGLLLNLIEKVFHNKKNNTQIAIVASSVIFGLGHIFGVLGQPILIIITKVVWTIAMGLYFGTIYKKTNNLWLPIILHFVIDVCALPYCFTTTTTYPNLSLYIILPTYILLGIYSFYIMKQNTIRKDYMKSCEISTVESINLGGYNQKIAIEGKSKKLPIVVTLHGGPGSPIPFSVGCRGLFPDFTDHFIMVYWDQLGCGINNYEIDNHFTIEHFVTMTIDLIKELKIRFPENKIYLFGMSWGSILALYSAIRVPELLSGVVTCGQVVTAPMLSDHAFEAVEASTAPEKKKKFARKLHSKETNITIKEMTDFSKIIRKYTDGYNNKSSKPAPVGKIIKGLLTSPDYSFKDFIAIIKNGYIKNESLLREMASKNLSKLFNEITIPYLIFQGETDIVTDTKSVIKLVDELNNQNVSCNILPNVGHFPTEDSMNQILEKIIRISM